MKKSITLKLEEAHQPAKVVELKTGLVLNAGEPAHLCTQEVFDALTNGADPFASEREHQNNLFVLLAEYGAIQNRLKTIEKDIQNAAENLNKVRGHRGAIPKLEKMHSLLRFLPEVSKKGK